MLDLWTESAALLGKLEADGLDYAIAGAIALAIHGAPRATSDIDLLVLPDALESILAVARSRGFNVEAMPMRFSDGMEVRRTTKIDDDGDTLTLDLILVNGNLQAIWDSRLRLESELGHVSVISREGLIQMKTWAGRERDIGDIRRLEDLDR